MQRRLLPALGCLAVLLLAGGLVGAVGADAPQQDEDGFPRAEAGLDQTVERNASVLLDGSQSFSPEGEIVDYDWQIERPSGNATTPNCDSSDCSLARFRVPELGQYNVTLTVTDDGGRQRSDTLYVTVVPEGDFSVELTGPGATGQNGTLSAAIAPGEATPQNVTWYRSGAMIGNQTAPPLGGTVNTTAFIVPGATYRVVVDGTWNRSVSDTWTASGGGSWSPSVSGGNYPRIEGPSVVTGTPDRTRNENWVYDSAYYRVQTDRFGSVDGSTWAVEGSTVDHGPPTRGEHFAPDLSPGMNVVIANTRITQERTRSTVNNFGDEINTSELTRSLQAEYALERRVLVDPAPQISGFYTYHSGDLIGFSFSSQDPYNPPERIKLTVAGTVVYPANSGGASFDNEGSVEIPSDTYGETTARLRVIDGRGQVATSRDTVMLPERTDTSEASSEAYRLGQESGSEDRRPSRCNGNACIV